MPTYCTITELEMDALLKHDKGWSKTIKGNEYVYAYQTKKNPNISLLVYSSISPNGVSKKCGSDSIKVCAVNTKTNKGVRKTNRIHRTSGWDIRLKERVIGILQNL